MSFDKNVFINCPFDDEYNPLLKALIFVILYLGFEPKISITKSSGHQRILRIMKLMEDSKFSIHDISRSEGDPPRFNMPYELGIDIGCCAWGNNDQNSKLCLILEKTKNRYDVVLSDISGQDVKAHNNNPKKLIESVIEWFGDNDAIDPVPSVSKSYYKYLESIGKIHSILVQDGYSASDIKNLRTNLFIKLMKAALAN